MPSPGSSMILARKRFSSAIEWEWNQDAMVKPYSIASASARQLASIMLALAPTVVHRSVPLPVSINTRVTALVPSLVFRIRFR